MLNHETNRENTMDKLEELSAISKMLNTAKEHNLEVECVWSALNDIATIDRDITEEDIVQACANALNEWDI